MSINLSDIGLKLLSPALTGASTQTFKLIMTCHLGKSDLLKKIKVHFVKSVIHVFT